jgi:hypothetical protein
MDHKELLENQARTVFLEKEELLVTRANQVIQSPVLMEQLEWLD